MKTQPKQDLVFKTAILVATLLVFFSFIGMIKNAPEKRKPTTTEAIVVNCDLNSLDLKTCKNPKIINSPYEFERFKNF